MVTTEIHRLTPETFAYEEVNTLLMAIASLVTASCYRVDGHARFNPGDYATIECLHLNARVRLPLYGPVEAAIAGRKPDRVEIAVVPTRAAERTYAIETAGFQAYTRALLHPFIVSCFERHRPSLDAQFPAGRAAWPANWQMAWAVRNAVVHGGRVFERSNQQAVTWRGLSFSPADEPDRCLLDLLSGGDLLVLMIDLGGGGGGSGSRSGD